MAPHTITPAVGAVCHCKANAGLRCSPQGLHTRTSGFVTKDDLVPFRCSPVFSCVAPLQTEALIARRLRILREDTGAPSEDATCAWMAADEAVGCTRAFLTMWRSSR
ncbi:uncharacterized protein TNCV_1698151 [Trichonephila clavipes]|nr:uncharacterized protein TNCV_1698151 [Trichonephila clavipes]